VPAGQGRLQLALHDRQILELHQQVVLGRETPARQHVELVEGHGRFVEPGRQQQHCVARVEHEGAADIGGIDAARQIGKAGNGRHRRRGRLVAAVRLGQARRLGMHPEAGQAAFDAV
jgi:hypothetical protein